MFEITVEARRLNLLQNLIHKLKGQPKLVEELLRVVNEKYKPSLLSLLSQEPPPRQGAVDWTSEAQRVTVLGILRRRARAAGRSDIRYIRTHALSRSYQVDVVPSDVPGGFAIQFANPTPYHVYVKWKWQQRFHARTGWQYDLIPLASVQAQMADDFVDRAVVAFQVTEG